MPPTSPKKLFIYMKAMTFATSTLSKFQEAAPLNRLQPARPERAFRLSPMKQKILVVDDEPDAVELIEFNLKSNGYDVTTAADGEEALEKARALLPNLIILDIMLPEVDGMEVCKILRRDQRTSGIPIIMLTAKAAEIDRVLGLELGADDYVTKPFWPEELLARVAARLRRPVLSRSTAVRLGDLTVDIDQRRVAVAGEPVELTRVEFDLLAALVRRQGSAVSRAWLAEHVLDPDREGGERTLDVHMSRLRKKLGAAASVIATVWGVGYRLESPPR